VTLDDELVFLQPFQIVEDIITKSSNQQPQQQQHHKDSRSKNSNWTYGPASYWYSQVNQTESDDFEYGFKQKKSIDGTNNKKNNSLSEENQIENDDTFSLSIPVNELEIPGESYLLVNTLNWEDKIIYDNNNTREKVDLGNERIKYAGWIPSADHRSLSSFQSKVLGKNVEYLSKKDEGKCL
jgi:hypothetical protein